MMPINSTPISSELRSNWRILVTSSISRSIIRIIMNWTPSRKYPSKENRILSRSKNLRAIINSWTLNLPSPRTSQIPMSLAKRYSFRPFLNQMWYKSMSSNPSKNKPPPTSIRSSSCQTIHIMNSSRTMKTSSPVKVYEAIKESTRESLISPCPRMKSRNR